MAYAPEHVLPPVAAILLHTDQFGIERLGSLGHDVPSVVHAALRRRGRDA